MCKGGLTRNDLYDFYSSYKSEETELILSFKNPIMQILMYKVVTILQFTCLD